MTQVAVSRKSRNIGIAASASANSGPNGWYFAPMQAPVHTGGCATIRRELAEYRRTWGTNTYYRVDLFVGGRRVAKDDGSYDKLVEFCRDSDDVEYGYRDQVITVSIADSADA